MSDKTGIEWTDATWNPVTGCTKVSAGCKHCYAEREWPRMTRLVPAYSGRAFTDVRTHPDRLGQPLRWSKPRKVFVNSMSDLFHPDVPDDFLPEVFAIMAVSKLHTFQILTKRPERMREVLNDGVFFEAVACSAKQHGIELKADDWPLSNVWIGVSVEDQLSADERIPLLLETPAAVRWISAEPMLGPVELDNVQVAPGDFQNCLSLEEWEAYPNAPEVLESVGAGTLIDWVVAGGESGPKARPIHPDWVRSLRDQCAIAGVPFLFKQWGEWSPYCTDVEMVKSNFRIPTDHHYLGISQTGEIGRDIIDPQGMHWLRRTGKKAAGRMLDGVLHDEYPEV